MIQLKRIYEAASEADGYRILVDRMWPRGVSKAKAQVDLWLKDIAPSKELRQWFGHDPEKWDGFYKQYQAELAEKPELVQQIRDLEQEHGTVTLLYAAKDEQHNNAVVLGDFVKR